MEQEKILNDTGYLLFVIKYINRLRALALDSLIVDDEIQLQDNLEY